MKVLITGANGFVGKNLQLHLAERKDVQVVCFTRGDDVAQLPALLQGVDFVFHLAGVNRPQDPQEFTTGNVDLTQALCQAVGAVAVATGKPVPIVYTSSAQAGRDNPYGQSKRGAEDALLAVARSHRVPVHIFRLPNVFGKWCKPNYNSAVATFCHNIARDLPIQVNDPAAPVNASGRVKTGARWVRAGRALRTNCAYLVGAPRGVSSSCAASEKLPWCWSKRARITRGKLTCSSLTRTSPSRVGNMRCW